MAGIFDSYNALGGLYGLGNSTSTLLGSLAPPIKRKAFFSFHFDDVMRVNVVRNAWKISHPDNALMRRFYDSSLWESRKREGPESLEQLIGEGVNNTSAIGVPVGSDTWSRRWVRYEVARAIIDGRELLAVHLNSINHHQTLTPYTRGTNPLAHMAVGKVQPCSLSAPVYYLFEWTSQGWLRYLSFEGASGFRNPRQPSLRLENNLARDHGELYLALHAGFVEGRVLATRMQFCRIYNERFVRVEADEIARRADLEPSLRQTEDLGRPDGHRGNETPERNFPGMNEPQARRKHSLQADRAIFRLGERQAFGFDILRVMLRNDGVDEARLQSRDERAPLVFVAQRRREFQKRPVIAHVVFVEGQMVDRGGAGYRQAISLGFGDNVEGKRRGDERGMVAGAGEVHEPDVAIEHDGLRLARDSGKAEARGEFAFVHHALAR